MRRTWPSSFIGLIVSTTCSFTCRTCDPTLIQSNGFLLQTSTTGSDELFFTSLFSIFIPADPVLPLRHTLPKTNPKITTVQSHGRWLISPQRPLTFRKNRFSPLWTFLPSKMTTFFIHYQVDGNAARDQWPIKKSPDSLASSVVTWLVKLNRFMQMRA